MKDADVNDSAQISWTENNQQHTALWQSEARVPPPKRVVVVDDTLTADSAYRLACEGTALLWRGDFQNARQLLQALARRVDHKPKKASVIRKALNQTTPAVNPAQVFHLHRQAQSQRARTLGMLLLQFNADYSLGLRRAPEVSAACREVWGDSKEPFVASLRELLGLVGAHEWRKKGVPIPALDAKIYPHYGVFSPVRGEYIELIANTSLPQPIPSVAFDIGTGTGVLAALLAKRGIQNIIATDVDARAIECARENLSRLNLNTQVQLVQADLFPEGKADLIVCNPPWVPARPNAPLEHAIYDFQNRMLQGFLNGLGTHLNPQGQGWLLLSDFAEHLGLRTRAELLSFIQAAGLKVLDRTDIRPNHPRIYDAADPLHAARAAEVTSLWRLTSTLL